MHDRVRRRGRPKAATDDELRTRVVEAAFSRFLDLGYGSTRMLDVAADLGMSKATVYRLFPTKQDLFGAVVGMHRKSMLDLPRPPGEDVPVEVALGRIFMIDIDPREDEVRHAFLRIVMEEMPAHPEIGAIVMRDGADEAARELSAWLASEHDRGRVVAPVPEDMARMLMAAAFAGQRREPPMEPARRKEYLRMCLAALTEGLRPR